MEKYLTYSVAKRKTPNSDAGLEMFYGRSQSRGEAGIRELSKRIQQMCTVTRADVMAVLIALEDVVAEALSNGEIVRLGELGSLQVSLKSKGTLSELEFDDSMIIGKRIIFRSGLTLSNMLDTLKFERVPVKYTSTPADPGKTEEGEKGDEGDAGPQGDEESEEEAGLGN